MSLHWGATIADPRLMGEVKVFNALDLETQTLPILQSMIHSRYGVVVLMDRYHWSREDTSIIGTPVDASLGYPPIRVEMPLTNLSAVLGTQFQDRLLVFNKPITVERVVAKINGLLGVPLLDAALLELDEGMGTSAYEDERSVTLRVSDSALLIYGQVQLRVLYSESQIVRYDDQPTAPVMNTAQIQHQISIEGSDTAEALADVTGLKLTASDGFSVELHPPELVEITAGYLPNLYARLAISGIPAGYDGTNLIYEVVRVDPGAELVMDADTNTPDLTFVAGEYAAFNVAGYLSLRVKGKAGSKALVRLRSYRPAPSET